MIEQNNIMEQCLSVNTSDTETSDSFDGILSRSTVSVYQERSKEVARQVLR